MPSSEAAAERRAAKAAQMGAPLPPMDNHDPLPCPRCESTNTKFCYYNNYNYSQPRHFCKSCRRYWTHGGTLRDIPVGGGSRKTAKRSRTSSPASSSTTSSSSGGMDPIPATPVFVSLSSNSGPAGPGPMNHHHVGGVGSGSSSFTSLLSGGSGGGGHAGILALGGFEDVGFGLGRGVWAFPDMGYVSGGGGANMSVAVANGVGDGHDHVGVSRGDTWHVESGENGYSVGDCFTALPELAISTPGNGLK